MCIRDRVKADGQGKESLMAENVTGFTPDLSEAESKNSVGIVVDFKAGDKKYCLLYTSRVYLRRSI